MFFDDKKNIADLFSVSNTYANPLFDDYFSATDGIGSKADLLYKSGYDWDFQIAAVDCFAMCANDLLSIGAIPLYFSDYIKIPRTENTQEYLVQLAKGLKNVCKNFGVKLIGGETAIYGEEFDIAGNAVGKLHKNIKTPILGKSIKEGDIIFGLKSSGLHANGFTHLKKGGFPVVFIETKIYINEIKSLMDNYIYPSGIFHISGGGFLNLKRYQNNDNFVFDINGLKINDFWRRLQCNLSYTQNEMFENFNMGYGMVFIVDPSKEESVKSFLPKAEILGMVKKSPSEEKVINISVKIDL